MECELSVAATRGRIEAFRRRWQGASRHTAKVRRLWQNSGPVNSKKARPAEISSAAYGGSGSICDLAMEQICLEMFGKFASENS